MTDFDDDEDEIDIEDLFPFTQAERELIAQIDAAVRRRMSSAEPEHLKKIASFLYALERLPYQTDDVFLDLAVVNRVGENLAYVSIELTSDSFRLSRGGSIYSSDVGSDSYSETTFEVESGGFRDGTTDDFREWLDAFVCASGEIKVEGDDLEDLSEWAPEDGWERLAEYWAVRWEDV